jgi:UDP-N-acetyl-D-glucosamine dehydrogenase
MSGRPEKVVILGQGYVGLSLALRAVEVGFDVTGIEIDTVRVGRLQRCESYIEDITDKQLVACRDTGRYVASSQPEDCAGFDIAVITVPTPLSEGFPDLSFIEESARLLARFLRPGATVILESTTYPGTTTELVRPILEEGSGLTAGSDFHLGYSPERIDPGNPTWGIINTPKVVSGIDTASLGAVRAFYDRICETTVPVSNPKVAELAKLLENTFRHVNIALVNELAMFAQALDVDVWEAIDAASTKPFGFMPFRPGPGVGGHCLPIDPSYLSWKVRRTIGESFRFIDLANDINDHMPDYVVRRLMLALNERGRAVRGSRILVLGLAYKRNTADAREAPAIAVAERLVALGADVRAADPHVRELTIDPAVTRVDGTPEEAAAADAVVLVTDHDRFDLDSIVAAAPYVLDTCNRVTGPHVERL